MRTSCIIGLIFIAAYVCWVMSGCTQTEAWKVDPNGEVVYFKSNSFCNYQQFTELSYGDLSLGRYEGKPQEVRAVTPYGIIETKEEK